MYAKKFRTVAMWPDTHTPNHDLAAVRVAKDIIQYAKVSELIFLGDFFDVATLSTHDKPAELQMTSLRDEIKVGTELWHSIVKRVPRASLVFLEGNHEKRLEKFLDKNAAQLTGLLEPKKIFGIPDKCKYIPYSGPQSFYKVPGCELIATHGSLCGSNPAKAMLDKYKTSVVFGHTHKLQLHCQSDVYGHVRYGVSAGHLADVHTLAGYIKNVPDWQQGMALAHIKRNGRLFIETIPISNGECAMKS